MHQIISAAPSQGFICGIFLTPNNKHIYPGFCRTVILGADHLIFWGGGGGGWVIFQKKFLSLVLKEKNNLSLKRVKKNNLSLKRAKKITWPGLRKK